MEEKDFNPTSNNIETPAPTPEPTPEPAAEPAPEQPAPEATPEQSASEAAPEAAPAPTEVEAAPALEPAPEATPEPTPEPLPTPVAEPVVTATPKKSKSTLFLLIALVLVLVGAAIAYILIFKPFGKTSDAGATTTRDQLAEELRDASFAADVDEEKMLSKLNSSLSEKDAEFSDKLYGLYLLAGNGYAGSAYIEFYGLIDGRELTPAETCAVDDFHYLIALSNEDSSLASYFLNLRNEACDPLFADGAEFAKQDNETALAYARRLQSNNFFSASIDAFNDVDFNSLSSEDALKVYRTLLAHYRLIHDEVNYDNIQTLIIPLESPLDSPNCDGENCL